MSVKKRKVLAKFVPAAAVTQMGQVLFILIKIVIENKNSYVKMYHQWSVNQYITCILLTLVFLSSWTDINGIYSELPQIVLTQPESWKLGAYLALITNLGNIAPLLLVLIKCFYKKHKLNFWVIINTSKLRII